MDINKVLLYGGEALVLGGLTLQPSSLQNLMMTLGYVGIFAAQSPKGYFASLKSRAQRIQPSSFIWAAMGALCLGGTYYLATRNTQPAGCEKVASDICKIHSNYCEGNLGIPRLKMPQFDGEVMKSFLSENAHSCETIPATALAPIQNEGNFVKIQSMMHSTTQGIWNACTHPILITKDSHILDGHHRGWACSWLNRTISVFRLLNFTAPQGVNAANAFPGVQNHDFDVFND